MGADGEPIAAEEGDAAEAPALPVAPHVLPVRGFGEELPPRDETSGPSATAPLADASVDASKDASADASKDAADGSAADASKADAASPDASKPDAGADASAADASRDATAVDASKPPTTNGILYHGGPVPTAPETLYFIWYGGWAGNSATTLLPLLAQHIGGSPYFNINATYTGPTGTAIPNAVTYGGATTDSYSQGKSLGDAQVAAVVASAVGSKRLPTDVNGVYFVFTSADVNETSGFCTRYCGWHTAASLGGAILKYAFVGNGDRCPSACEAQAVSPNGNPGADGMASVMAHELDEATTDPLLNAWFDTTGEENADKCAWTFGATTLTGGARVNVTLGGKAFLIQQNWVNAGGGSCAMHYP